MKETTPEQKVYIKFLAAPPGKPWSVRSIPSLHWSTNVTYIWTTQALACVWNAKCWPLHQDVVTSIPVRVRLSIMVHQFGCVELLLSHLTTKPLTKLVTGGGLFSTDACPCSVALVSPPVSCVSFFLFSSSIFFLNISMKLPSLANAFPPGTGALPAEGAGLPEGDAGLESPLLLPPLVWGLPCAGFESMFMIRQSSAAQSEYVSV